MANVEDDDLLTLHRVEHRVSKSADVDASNAQHFCFFRRKRMIDKPGNGRIDQIGKCRRAARIAVEQIRNGAIQFPERRVSA
jgi:hypothetical protein